MKKFTAILVSLLLIFTLSACVDNQGDTDGDVRIPGRESQESSSTNKKPGGNGSLPGGYIDSNGEINLPRDEF